MIEKVADLTVDQLRDEVIEEKLGMLVDPDEGLALTSDMADSLNDYLQSNRRGTDATDVFRSLGLDGKWPIFGKYRMIYDLQRETADCSCACWQAR